MSRMKNDEYERMKFCPYCGRVWDQWSKNGKTDFDFYENVTSYGKPREFCPKCIHKVPNPAEAIKKYRK